MTPRSHDALFKSAFEAPADAAALLRELLPAVLCELIAWDTLHGEPGSSIDPALADHHSDLLFSVRLRTDAAELIHVFARAPEHRRSGDAAAHAVVSHPGLEPVSQGAARRVASADHHCTRQSCAGRWTTSRSLDDLFAPSVLAVPGLSASIPRSSLIIDDLAHLSNDDLKARSLAAFQKLALWLLRDARAPRRLLDNFDTWIETFAEAERAPAGIDTIATLLTYMFRVIDPMHHDELRAKIYQLGPDAEETAMTIAEQWHEEGREEGRIAALRAQLIAKFGPQALDATYEARLQAATPAAVDHYLQRVLVADSLAAVFED